MKRFPRLMCQYKGGPSNSRYCLRFPPRAVAMREPFPAARITAQICRTHASDDLIIKWSRTISRVLSPPKRVAIIPLGRTLLSASSNLPENHMVGPTGFPIWSCSGRGLPSRICYHIRRWSLTPPFHPYLPKSRRSTFCCTFQRSLSPGVTRRPALWSPDFPPQHICCGDSLSDSIYLVLSVFFFNMLLPINKSLAIRTTQYLRTFL